MYVYIVISYTERDEGVTIESLWLDEDEAKREMLELAEFIDDHETFLEVVTWWAK